MGEERFVSPVRESIGRRSDVKTGGAIMNYLNFFDYSLVAALCGMGILFAVIATEFLKDFIKGRDIPSLVATLLLFAPGSMGSALVASAHWYVAIEHKDIDVLMSSPPVLHIAITAALLIWASQVFIGSAIWWMIQKPATGGKNAS